MEIQERANKYASEKTNEVMIQAIAQAYRDGYQDGYKDCEREIPLEVQKDKTEFVDLGLPSGTLWAADYEKKDGKWMYLPYEKASTLTSNPQPIGFSGILLAKRQNSFYCTYFLHNRNVADTKSPYPIKRLEV
ncbi:MAG: hypothetical protein PUC18_12130, partial [Prevotellaceae bacterium]|nr:hypothetical protein [Prevotellaceae bacterium]